MKLLATLVTFAFLASAQTTFAACAEKYQVYDETQVQIVKGNSSCFLTVHPRSLRQNLVYRDFLFDEDGLFMVFNSFGPGDETKKTGAREYRFFPRNKATLSYTYDAKAKRIHVTAPSGKVFVFNSQNGALVSVSGSTISQDKKVSPSNRGGIEFTANNGLMLDGGFTLGQSPSQNPKNKITFKDSKGRQCQVTNADVHRYASGGDVIFRYDDAQLKSVLQSRCPNMSF